LGIWSSLVSAGVALAAMDPAVGEDKLTSQDELAAPAELQSLLEEQDALEDTMETEIL